MNELFKPSYIGQYFKYGMFDFANISDNKQHDIMLVDLDIKQASLFDKQAIISKKACASDNGSITYECIFCHKQSFMICFWKIEQYWSHKKKKNRFVIYKALTNILYIKENHFKNNITVNPCTMYLRNYDVIGYIESVEDTLQIHKMQKHKNKKSYNKRFAWQEKFTLEDDDYLE